MRSVKFGLAEGFVRLIWLSFLFFRLIFGNSAFDLLKGYLKLDLLLKKNGDMIWDLLCVHTHLTIRGCSDLQVEEEYNELFYSGMLTYMSEFCIQLCS